MSPGLAEGKTTLALRLAVTLSEASRARVVLVEGNFERPRLAASLGLRCPRRPGSRRRSTARMDGRAAAWGVVRLGPSLSLLAEPAEGAAYPEALHSALFEAAIAALRRSYDYVVIDGPAVVGSGDANVIEVDLGRRAAAPAHRRDEGRRAHADHAAARRAEGDGRGAQRAPTRRRRRASSPSRACRAAAASRRGGNPS